MTAAQIGNLNVRMGIDTAEFSNGVRAVQGSLSGLVGSLKAFAGAAAATTLFTSTVQAVKTVAEIGDVAESIGVSAEQLQVFEKMAIASGASSAVLTRGLQTIAEQSVDTNSKLAQLFEANGLSLKGKEINQIIREFMELIKAARTPAEQLAIITDVLGAKVGRQLVESFRSGAAGVDQATRDMVASGLYHTDEEVKRLQEIETKYNEVTHNIGVVWREMVIGLIENGSEFYNWLNQTSQAVISQMQTPEVTAKLEALRAQLANYEAQMANGLGGRAKFEVEQEISRIKSLIAVYEQAAKVSGISDISGADGKADLPGNINPGNFSLEKTTVMPVKEIKKEITEAEKAFQKLKEAGQLVWEQTRTPIESYQLEIRRLNDLFKAGVIDSATYARAIQQAKDAFSQAMPETAMFGEALEAVSLTIGDSLVSGLAGLVNGTMSVKDSFREMARSIVNDLQDIAAQLLRSGLQRLLLGSLGGQSFPFGGFDGFYANGGTLGAGKWGIAGEAGPEIIHGPAKITPISAGGGATSVSWSPSITINGSADQRQISAVMAAEREKFKADLPKMIRDARKRGSI